MTQKTPVESRIGYPTGTPSVSLVYPTPLHLFLFTAFAIFAGEVIVMLILAMIQPLEIASEALVDGIMLTILVTPFLYLFLFRPMVLHVAERKAAEEALQSLNAELEVAAYDLVHAGARGQRPDQPGDQAQHVDVDEEQRRAAR
jgi:hypothetical protein